ncbi:MAG: YiiD C-terminal domain-containing protein [Steroidobacteraceae bacterium]
MSVRPTAFDAPALRTYLRDHIPLAAAMDIAVLDAHDGAVVLGAPLAPNINHRDTAFGGSVAALAILAAWSLLHLRLQAAGIPNRLVIQRSTVDYDLPIAGAFTARASLEAPPAWAPFVKLLQRRGKARIAVVATLEYEGRIAARFAGDFVALAGP